MDSSGNKIESMSSILKDLFLFMNLTVFTIANAMSKNASTMTIAEGHRLMYAKGTLAQFATKRHVIVIRSNASSSAPLPKSAVPWIAISTTSFTIAAQRKYLPPTARFVLYRER